jgi:hypothetical protein
VLYRFRWFIAAFSTVLALAPLSGVIAAAILATLVGCEMNDAASSPCPAFGLDFAPLLYGLSLTATLGWISFAVLTALLVMWAAIEVVALVVRWWQSGRRAV